MEPQQEQHNLAELVERLGGVPLERIRTRPYIGTAREDDVVRAGKPYCELIYGVLVERAYSFFEAVLLVKLGGLLDEHSSTRKLGAITGAGGLLRLKPGLVRSPDLCFIRWSSFPNGRIPDGPIADLRPDLAIEALRPSNTLPEMELKIRQYFEAGTQSAWLIDAPARTIRHYSTPHTFRLLTADEILAGDTVLPDVRFHIGDWFNSTGFDLSD